MIELLVIFCMFLILCVVAFFGGPALLEWLVNAGEAIEEKANEWREIFAALRDKDGGA